MPKPELTIVTALKLTLPQWQLAIDKEEFLLPIVLDPSQAGQESGTWRAMLGGEQVTFDVVERDLSTVGGGREMPKGVRFAFSTPGTGAIKSCAAGGMALLAYASAGHGGFVQESGEILSASLAFRQHLDGMVAVAFGKMREYEARYPPGGRGGRGETVIDVRRAQ